MVRVFKFGGALMKDASGVRKVAAIVEEFSCEPLVVVVSALGKTTNALEQLLEFALEGNENELQQKYYALKSFHLNIANELLEDAGEIQLQIEDCFRDLWDTLNEKHTDSYFAYDQAVGFGEKLAALILTYYLLEKNIKAEDVASEMLFVTNSNFTDATINWEYTKKTIEARLIPKLENKTIIVTQGFTAADLKGNSTTLGREGSDFTAAILANVLNTQEVTIWKDVPGLMNADPKRFKNTHKLDNISYHEAIELAFYGASVIHPKTIQPLKEKNIVLNIRSFEKPETAPSVISNDISRDEELHKIIIKDNQVLLSITSKQLDFISEENLTTIFKAFSKSKIHINLMQNSAVSFSVCFKYENQKLEQLTKELGEKFSLRYNTGLQLITIRYYTEELIREQVKDRKVYLEQKSRSTVQLLVK